MISLLIAASLAWGQQPNVILVTMDTTRADAIGAYDDVFPGLLIAREGVTPTLDAMAGRGVRFDRFYAHAPTTLNSHTSLFTGRDPHEHAVPRNGYGLPDDLRTQITRVDLPYGQLLHSVPGGGGSGAGAGLAL